MADTCIQELTVVVPQYNAWQETIACCSSLRRHHGERLGIIVVDDGSAAEDREYARRYLGANVRVLTQRHQGVTAAWNLGLGAVDTRYAVLLNNDAMTLRAWGDAAVRLLEQNPWGVLGAECRREPALERISTLASAVSSRLLSGWCLGFRMKLFRRVGPFDESLALYWSDTDWQVRWSGCVGGSAKFSLLPKGVLRHRGHQSTRRLRERSALWTRDRKRFFAKWELS